MHHFNDYNHTYTPIEMDLAHEIAERLNDPGSLSQFLTFARDIPHDFLREALDIACNTPDHRVIKTRAAIFVNRVNNYRAMHNGGARH